MTGKQLLDVGQSLYDYQNRVALLNQFNFPGTSQQLQQLLQQMMAPSPSARPSAAAVVCAQYIQLWCWSLPMFRTRGCACQGSVSRLCSVPS